MIASHVQSALSLRLEPVLVQNLARHPDIAVVPSTICVQTGNHVALPEAAISRVWQQHARALYQFLSEGRSLLLLH